MARPFQRQLLLWADFNSLDEDCFVTTSLRFAETADRPVRGELVRLYDDEGNEVMGVVERVDGVVVHIRPEIETWTTANISLSPFTRTSPYSAEAQEVR
jgi:hypothetical protein